MFAAAHYAALAVFVVSCWGCGRALLSRFGAPPRPDVWLAAAMATTLGVGLFVCAFQALAIAGVFGRAGVVALVAAGLVAAALQCPAWLRELRAGPADAPFSALDRIALAALALVALPTLVAPLAPPAVFDELMYHLPYARQVAESGSLGIHAWLRYPWFPYDYNLLFAAALTVGDDVLPHFLSALAGWLSVGIVYRLGMQHTNRMIACVGAAIWLGLGDYAGALIDAGTALFVLAACVALWWWRESPPQQGARWLALAAFCLGVAAGSKYQALTFLPLVALFVARHERRPRVWGVALLCFLIPCVYWYARNALMTGDPFNPIGARLFGFTNWIPADYVQQVADVHAHANPPNPLLWAFLWVPFGAAWKRSVAVRAAFWFGAYAVVVWLLTSRYPRYLSAAYPLIAICAALGWQRLLSGIATHLHRAWPQHEAAFARGGRAALGLLMAVLVVFSAHQALARARMISPTPQAREAFLRANVPGYGVMSYLRAHPSPGRVYQVALSEAIYYGPNPIWGDALGPWRYADFILLPADQMARKLAAQGFDTVVVSGPVAPALTGKPGFDHHFALLYQEDGARAYRILPTAP
ncbi:ArnT family glycosyltransferase [Variovorax sp. PBL-E5]|uniref:ArnT family glycosyltransferase n=1 Tax=Variovorax sp. PBL-E5 TaxID=434014 RepID=UPI0013177115|nr:glycosyltransferase family 39 protein [Variovorax sp. PBL-E5]VTU16695.1 hypothetical protein E5CHR_00197 [Variovorax sp. PBL-E5]